MGDLRTSLFSEREEEFIRGLHDDKYYQYRANLRMRVRRKLELLADDLPLLLGNERLDMEGDPFDWSCITEPVAKFLERV